MICPKLGANMDITIDIISILYNVVIYIYIALANFMSGVANVSLSSLICGKNSHVYYMQPPNFQFPNGQQWAARVWIFPSKICLSH